MVDEKLITMSPKHRSLDCVMCQVIKRGGTFSFMFMFFYQANVQGHLLPLVKPWNHPTDDRNFLPEV